MNARWREHAAFFCACTFSLETSRQSTRHVLCTPRLFHLSFSFSSSAFFTPIFRYNSFIAIIRFISTQIKFVSRNSVSSFEIMKNQERYKNTPFEWNKIVDFSKTEWKILERNSRHSSVKTTGKKKWRSGSRWKLNKRLLKRVKIFLVTISSSNSSDGECVTRIKLQPPHSELYLFLQ